MAVSIVEAHPVLWHYTTAVGLNGILRSQQLWATNFQYLNDDEELRGFFERKLPLLLETGINNGIEKVLNTKRGEEMLKFAGSVEGIRQQFLTGLKESITSTTLALDVFVTSFCYLADERDQRDGLLSQWRGYGADGGYAIAFKTEGLNELLPCEQERYKHAYLAFSDVDYHSEEWMSDDSRHEETIEAEQHVIEIISKVVVDGNLEKEAENLFVPIVAQAIRHKHYGFKEEREVRVATVRLPKHILKEAKKAGEDVPEKHISFYPRAGVLVPYISLFDGIPQASRRLPIKEIIVGPHPEKLKRQKSVQMLLEELEIEAEVRVSDIPYLGR